MAQLLFWCLWTQIVPWKCLRTLKGNFFSCVLFNFQKHWSSDMVRHRCQTVWNPASVGIIWLMRNEEYIYPNVVLRNTLRTIDSTVINRLTNDWNLGFTNLKFLSIEKGKPTRALFPALSACCMCLFYLVIGSLDFNRLLWSANTFSCWFEEYLNDYRFRLRKLVCKGKMN